MKLLAIDTSTEQASVGLLNDNVLTERFHPSQRQHAHFLLPLIDELLIDSAINLNQLDGIIFGRGPGSFTGIRIACSVAKGLAYAHDLPLFPCSTLSAIAEETLTNHIEETAVLSVIDARMNQVYWQYVSPTYQSEEQVSFAADIFLPSNESIILAGVGFDSYLKQLPSEILIKNTYTVYPTASAMLQLATKNKLTSISAEEALPVYIRNQVT